MCIDSKPTVRVDGFRRIIETTSETKPCRLPSVDGERRGRMRVLQRSSRWAAEHQSANVTLAVQSWPGIPVSRMPRRKFPAG